MDRLPHFDWPGESKQKVVTARKSVPRARQNSNVAPKISARMTEQGSLCERRTDDLLVPSNTRAKCVTVLNSYSDRVNLFVVLPH